MGLGFRERTVVVLRPLWVLAIVVKIEGEGSSTISLGLNA